MPTYLYECLSCKKIAEEKFSDEVAEHNGRLPIPILESEVMYKTSHRMEPTKDQLYEACECPRCGSHDAERTFHGSDITTYTRGYGYLDRQGCHRDMNKHKLVNDDPYAEYRQPGEVSHIKDNLDKGGKYNPNTKYFTPERSSTQDMEKVVQKSVDSQLPKDK